MVDTRRKIQAEKAYVERSLDNLREVMQRTERGTIELAACGAFLQSFYNGLENILKQAVASRQGTLPTTATWHRDLIESAVDCEILSRDLADGLYEYLTFRHFFVHAYGFMLEEALLLPLVENVEQVWLKFRDELGL